jgi:putative glutamine amidotransferase
VKIVKKPIIGITPLFDDDKDSIWMLPGYMNGIMMAGGLPFILPFTSDEEDILRMAEDFDGFVFTGGPDVDPSFYNEKKLSCCGEIQLSRDYLEMKLFNQLIKTDKPVLGICRGLQLINVALGGTLYQDLNSQRKEMTFNHQQNPPYNQPIHKIVICGSKLSDIYDRKEIMVNSCHHQAVKKLADRLKTAAISEDGVIEAAYITDKKFVLAVQYHPEFTYLEDEMSRRLFDEFVKNCKVAATCK